MRPFSLLLNIPPLAELRTKLLGVSRPGEFCYLANFGTWVGMGADFRNRMRGFLHKHLTIVGLTNTCHS